MNPITMKSGDNIYYLEKVPDECPICLTGIHVTMGSLHIVTDCIVQTISECPKCKRYFINSYMLVKSEGTYSPYYIYDSSEPKSLKEIVVNKVIEDLSPAFTEVYKQSLVADGQGLLQIVGCGLRKALEYLIKDYCINKDPENEAEIKAIYLGECINKYIKDQRIQEISKRAVWLGNDETHYVRQWESKDLTDLKKLLEISQHYILLDIESIQYITGMKHKIGESDEK